MGAQLGNAETVSPDAVSGDEPTASQEKRSAALTSVAAAVGLTSMKLVVGLLTGSLGILAEAAHSALDLVAALVTFFAVRVSDRPPDERHTYGHGKVENLSALVETLLLLVTCVWIIYEALQRLFFRSVPVEASIWGFVVMGISIVTDISRSRVLYHAARKHNSQALEADALHFSTDVWSSSVVIVGLGLVALSERLGGQWTWLHKGDSVAALVVALIVVKVSVELGRRAVAVLLDEVPSGLAAQIEAEALQVPGVRGLGRVRVRQSGASAFVDLVVLVARSTPLEEAHRIAAAVDERVSRLAHHGDVVVHVDPVRAGGESLTQTVGAIAARFGLRTHYAHAHEVRGRYLVDLHVEAPPDLTLGQAHERVSRMEGAIREELPQVADISSHIEPAAVPLTRVLSASEGDTEAVRAQVLEVVGDTPQFSGCDHLYVRPTPEGYDVVVHCVADPELPLTEAHRLADGVEKRVLALNGSVGRVLVHVEPASQG